ncbi:hypothetical protein [Dyella silvatica]|uniref:hypothetical protein n=1 Tax=Dyella silvatica TaxID=2992128 RepID=UPI002252A97E|nr:hypothetical protein [Dyella silvatica]
MAGICGGAWAQQPAAQGAGLGQSWPNARDVSTSPNWHVYVFERDGVRYIQINDLNGAVRAALATANGEYLVLPMGKDAQHVGTPQKPLSTISPSPSETIYRDKATQIQMAPQSNGTVSVRAMDCSDPIQCGGAIAK